MCSTEWIKFQKAQRITDTRKLAALLPAWIKRELAKPLPAKVEFVEHQPPKYLFPMGPDTLSTIGCIKFPSLTCAVDEITPDELARYVEQFDTMNSLKPTAIKWITPTHGNYA